jgi:STE24 endopeptidase
MFQEGAMRIRLLTLLAALVLGLGLSGPALAQDAAPSYSIVPHTAPTSKIEVAQLPPAGVSNFDPIKATDAYLAQIPAKDRARTDAYFEGGYVLQVVDLVYVLVVAGLLLWLKISSRMRTIAERITRYRWLQVPIYTVQYIVITTVVALPLTIYEGFFREHKYGLSNQTFGQWFSEFGTSFLIEIFAFSLVLTLIYAAARKVQRSWWKWGAGISVVFAVLMIAAGPVFIQPLFNKYTPLPESATRNAILSLARSQGIPAKDVFLVDASRQSKRVSANVSGLLGTTRIALNDNLMNRCTPSEVLQVLGHEMGHYVMNHVGNMIVWFGLIICFGFWFVDRVFHGLVRVFGARWDVRGIADPAGLPLIMAVFSVFMFLATPVTNTLIRTQEIQADLFGLNLVRQPDAEAKVDLMLGEYRKMDPSPLEEFLFFDHPSGRYRILMAMRWKAEHLNDPDIMAGPISPQ